MRIKMTTVFLTRQLSAGMLRLTGYFAISGLSKLLAAFYSFVTNQLENFRKDDGTKTLQTTKKYYHLLKNMYTL